MEKFSSLDKTLIATLFALVGLAAQMPVLAGPLGTLSQSVGDAAKQSALDAGKNVLKNAANKALQQGAGQAVMQGVTGAQLLAGLQDKAQQPQSLLYVLGVADASVNKSWCPPAYFDAHQMQQTLISYLDSQPDARLAGMAVGLVLDGMQERFGCKEEGQAALDLPKMPRQGEFDGKWLYLTVQEAQKIISAGKQDTQFNTYLQGVQDAGQHTQQWCGASQVDHASLREQLGKVQPAKPETLANLIATHILKGLSQSHPCQAK